MTHARLPIAGLALLLASVAFSVACTTEAPAPEAAGEDGPTSAVASSALAAGGFTVQEGRFSFLDMTACCASSCAGNNPSSPYAALFVPPAPGGLPDPNPAPDGMSSAFRLRADEAVVFVGQTPPEVRYFGFTPYLTDRAQAYGARRPVAALQLSAGPLNRPERSRRSRASRRKHPAAGRPAQTSRSD